MNHSAADRYPAVQAEAPGVLVAALARHRLALLAAPALGFYMLFFGWPVLQMFWQSVWSDGWTLSGYTEFMRHPGYWYVLAYTLGLGVACLVLTLVIGYPVALWLVRIGQRRAMLMMTFVLIPFWSSGLVRNYAWVVILGRNGVLNHFLVKTGLVAHPVELLGTGFAVTVGLVYYLLPYMILCLYNVMSAIDMNLVRAARSLGASPARAFFLVFVPLTRPGIFAGSFLVFMLAIGMYITPAMLGGPPQMTIPLVIADQIDQALDWSFAAALSVILLFVTVCLQIVSSKYINFDKMWGGAR